MLEFTNYLIAAGAAVVCVPIVVYFVECLIGSLSRFRMPAVAEAATSSATVATSPLARPRAALLIPAHNEEGVIADTLRTLLPQVADGDRLFVIADNCSDQTAQVARQAGAQVIERTDADRRGKGYALAFGVDHLRSDPPGAIVFVDADCTAYPGLVDGLVRSAVEHNRPVQGVYLLDAPPNPSPKDGISALAFIVKNLVRPLALHQVGLPTLLTGSGMAIPWSLIDKVPLASGNIVEDMQLGIDLALAGHPPRLCPEVLIRSRLPSQQTAAVSQRKRWEHGHLTTLLRNCPRLFFGGLTRLSPPLLGMAFDMCVPPLSFLVFVWLLAFLATGILWLAGGWLWPLILLAIAGVLLALATLFAWLRFGRQACPFTTLLSIPIYLLWKIPLYLAFFFKRQKQWVRTDRDK